MVDGRRQIVLDVQKAATQIRDSPTYIFFSSGLTRYVPIMGSVQLGGKDINWNLPGNTLVQTELCDVGTLLEDSLSIWEDIHNVRGLSTLSVKM